MKKINTKTIDLKMEYLLHGNGMQAAIAVTGCHALCLKSSNNQ